MAENDPLDTPNRNDNENGAAAEYLARAAQACAEGDMVLGMHLYLAAYEKELAGAQPSEAAAVDSLREAWHLAIDLRERSIAEYVFERLQPYLSGDEVKACASRLQDLALDRLEEYGFSRDELEGVAQMISDDLLGGNTSVLQIDHITLPPTSSVPIEAARKAPEAGIMQASGPAAEENDSSLQAQSDEQDGVEQAKPRPLDLQRGSRVAAAIAARASSNTQTAQHETEKLTYGNLIGYDETIDIMRDFGVGMMDDPAFNRFVTLLNQQHGLSAMPSLDSLLFRAVAREDATRFVEATIGELNLPALRITMEENIQGMPILCVTAQSDNQPRLNQARNRFDAPAILVVEDLDLWSVPQVPENAEGLGGFMMANLSRGARAAFDLIRNAVEDPDVYVLASAQIGEEVDPFFYDLLEPLSVIDIGYPTEKERRDIWHDIVLTHPSMRSINRHDLMRFSAGMPRYDIYMAAREALEEAYKLGLIARKFVPVSPQNIFEKLAACQPLGSDEYLALEEEVLRDFRHDLDNLEDLLGDA